MVNRGKESCKLRLKPKAVAQKSVAARKYQKRDPDADQKDHKAMTFVEPQISLDTKPDGEFYAGRIKNAKACAVIMV